MVHFVTENVSRSICLGSFENCTHLKFRRGSMVVTNDLAVVPLSCISLLDAS